MHVLVCVHIHARVQYVRVCVFVCACSLHLHQMLSLVDCTAMLSVALQVSYEFLHVQSVEGGNPKICPQCSKQISFFSSPSPRCSCHTNTAYGASPCGSSFLCMGLGANWHLLGFMIFVYLCLLLFFLIEAFIKFRQWIKFRKERKQRQKGEEGSKAQLQEGAEGLWQSSLVLCCYFILLLVHEVYPCSYIAITAAVAVCEPFRRSTSTQDCE